MLGLPTLKPEGPIPFGAGTGAFNSEANLVWITATKRLGIRTAAPTAEIDVVGSIVASGTSTINGAVLTGGANTFNITNGTASLDVAAGATLNVDANLTVSGAATISETPPLNANVLKGDGTAGRVLRQSKLLIEDGTNANTIKCTLTSTWNGDVLAVVDNIAKGATTGGYTLNATGYLLTITNTIITGDAVALLFAGILVTSYNEALTINYSMSGGLILNFATLLGADRDLTTYTGVCYVNLVYVTTA